MDYIAISKNILEPLIKSNIKYVDSIEEFEKIAIEPNETILMFDNCKPCFYVKQRDKFGDYLPVKIYFYEDFATRINTLEKDEFIKKCKKAGLNELKTEIACKFFFEKKTPQQVWLWLIDNDIKDYEWDYVRNLKCRLKKKLQDFL